MSSLFRHPRATTLWFVGLVLGVYTAALLIVDILPRLAEAGAVAAGLTLDLMVMLPLAFYILVVKPRKHSPLRVAPVVLLSLVLASLVIPRDQQHVLRAVEMVVLPLELGLVSWIISRALRSLRNAHRNASGDPLQQFYQAALELFKNERVAGIFASEVGVFYYALGAWRENAHVPSGSSSFSHHQRCGQAGLVIAFLFLMAGEGFAVHLLLAKWQEVAAWLFTASTVYGGLWLVADLRASILRPVVVGKNEVVFRAGLRQTLTVNRRLIIAITNHQPEATVPQLSLKLMGPATHWVHFAEPVLAQGPYGTSRWVEAVGMEPDDPAAFQDSFRK